MLGRIDLLSVLLLFVHSITTTSTHGSGSDDADESTDNPFVGLPGFNNMMRNKTSAKNATPYDAAFDVLCRYVSLGGQGKVGQTSLEAICKDEDGLWWYTSINLNDCIANEKGTLVFDKRGQFDRTCRPCAIDALRPGGDVLLKCNCLEKGAPMYTTIQLGSQDPSTVKPVDGRLVCGTKQGTKSPYY